MFEELLVLGVSGVEYDVWLICIGEGDQFFSGFVEINLNLKILVFSDYFIMLLIWVFEFGNIFFYLVEKFGFFLLKDFVGCIEIFNWLFWLQGVVLFFGGGFGYFYNYVLVKIEYVIDCFMMEVKCQFDVLDKQFVCGCYVVGEEYIIVDMVVWLWYGNVVLGNVYNVVEFFDVGSYKNVLCWVQDVGNCLVVKCGCIVNCINGLFNEQLYECYDV